MHKLLITFTLFLICSCASAPKQGQNSQAKPEIPKIMIQGAMTHPNVKGDGVNLDTKIKSRIHEGFRAIILNDDKKAKLSYGRAHKNMPEFLQFAYDLRFRNFDRAASVVDNLPYTDTEKEFWKILVSKKPPVISKYVCEWFKENKFSFAQSKAESKEADWFAEYIYVIEDFQKEYQLKNAAKKPELDKVFDKFTLFDQKRNALALSTDAQKILFDTAFFDKFRNYQRRDTNFYKANYWNVSKVVTYTPYYSPHYAWDLYWSMSITEHPKKNHFKRRLKGIIKDMRENLVMHRVLSSRVIDDEADYNKAYALAMFINRYPFISAFLRFDFTLTDCGYAPLKE